MCGTIPSAHCPSSSERTSVCARSGSTRARPIATNAESQFHWHGIEPLRRLDVAPGVVPAQDREGVVREAHAVRCTSRVVRTYRVASSGSAACMPASAAAPVRSPPGRPRPCARAPGAPPGRAPPDAARARRRAPSGSGARRSKGSVGIDVDRRSEAPGEDELGQRLEVDDVRAAHEHEHGARQRRARGRLARQQRLVLARRASRGRRSRARSRGARRERSARRPRSTEVGIGQPRVVRAAPRSRTARAGRGAAGRCSRSRRSRRASRRGERCRARRPR